MKIILCADDFGQNQAISDGIIDLVTLRRLSAVSCLTTSPYWDEHAAALKKHSQNIDIGLHFNLTWQLPAGKPLNIWIIQSQLRALNKVRIKKILLDQLNAFIKGIGRQPDFIDGHQHVHQFPIIRDALVEVYEENFANKQCYIRLALANTSSFKAKVIGMTGGIAMKKILEQHHIPHNLQFSGIYNFKQAKHYATLFSHFVSELSQPGLIMCHPGKASENNVVDEIKLARTFEYSYFKSDTFLELCQNQNIKLSRYAELEI